MTSPYQESFGDDDYYEDSQPVTPGRWEDDDYLPADWHYGSPGEELRKYRGSFGMWYNWKTHLWECRCDTYTAKGRCRHAYRFRRQETVEVNEDYL
jgi:hypothetical protein